MEAVAATLGACSRRQNGEPGGERSFASMELMLALCVVWNLVDLLATLFEVELGLAVEANPIMEFALSISPVLFAALKMTVVSLGLGLLWRFRRRPAAVFGSLGVFGVYSFIVAYHGYWLAGLAFEVSSSLWVPV